MGRALRPTPHPPRSHLDLKNLSNVLAVVLCLLVHPGCTRTFESTLYTYWSNPRVVLEPLVWVANPQQIFDSNDFWRLHSELNAEVEESTTNSLRARTQVRFRGVLEKDGEYFVRWTRNRFRPYSNNNEFFAKWAVQIQGGDQQTFDSLCVTYAKLHEAQFRKSLADARVFMQTRLSEFQVEYKEAKQAFEKTPDPNLKQHAEIAHNNYKHLEKRLTGPLIDYKNFRGRIARHMMAPFPSTD